MKQCKHYLKGSVEYLFTASTSQQVHNHLVPVLLLQKHHVPATVSVLVVIPWHPGPGSLHRYLSTEGLGPAVFLVSSVEGEKYILLATISAHLKPTGYKSIQAV